MQAPVGLFSEERKKKHEQIVGRFFCCVALRVLLREME